VNLPSGGYIIIEPTEALVSIDVNTGRYTGKKDPEKTILKTNVDAAREIARQLRLRDVGGIIVCDFIDMESKQNREKVLQELRSTSPATAPAPRPSRSPTSG
jgi:ribonuclease G